jgi:SpoU rRNA methylase family enzyme
MEINNARKILKHDKNKALDKEKKRRKNQKNTEKIQKLENMVVFRGHPSMRRIGKEETKEEDTSNRNEDEREIAYKRYVSMA